MISSLCLECLAILQRKKLTETRHLKYNLSSMLIVFTLHIPISHQHWWNSVSLAWRNIGYGVQGVMKEKELEGEWAYFTVLLKFDWPWRIHIARWRDFLKCVTLAVRNQYILNLYAHRFWTFICHDCGKLAFSLLQGTLWLLTCLTTIEPL